MRMMAAAHRSTTGKSMPASSRVFVTRVDVPVYPSYPPFITTGSDISPLADAATFALPTSKRLPSAAYSILPIIDPGSVNFSLTKGNGRHAAPASTYMNPECHIRYVLDFAARHRSTHQILRSTNPAFCEPAQRWRARTGVKSPIYRLMFCNLLAAGLPPKPYALAAYHALLEEEAARCALDDLRPSAPISARYLPRPSRAAAIFASASKMRRSGRLQPISRSSKKPSASCARTARSPLRLREMRQALAAAGS